MPCIFGLEQEMAMAAFDRHGQRVESRVTAERFMNLACATLPHLPAKLGAGIFLTNGSRLYIDCGKPEITTPEVCTPTDACRYMRAGETILAELASELPRRDDCIQRVVLTRANVSYGRSASTCGNHESFGHRVDPARLPAQLIPHLVTRQIYTGAGGFDNTSAGIEFMLSPRVSHLTQAVSRESQRNRGIFHTKDETLGAEGFHRLHLLCGEAVGSEISLWLRMGTTALIVAIVEAGHTPGEAVALAEPVADMLALAKDPTLSHPLAMATGASPQTAIAIQRHYLQSVEACLSLGILPDWAEAACRAWRQMLDRLERGGAAVDRSLDWAIKLSLFQRHAARRGIAWETLPRWNQVIAGRQRPINPSSLPIHRVVELLERATRGAAPIDGEVAELAQRLRRAGVAWEDLGRFLQLRQELFALDTRFGELSEAGIFQQLDRQGVLAHRLVDAAEIQRAVTSPPSNTRARLRGEFVQEFSRRGDGYWCDWIGCWNLPARRQLDLLNPFTTSRPWESWSGDEPETRGRLDASTRLMMEQLVSDYDGGRYDAAYYWFETLRAVRPRLATSRYRDLFRFAAWIQARLGELSGPEFLDDVARFHPCDLTMICDYACVYRFQGLIAPPELATWLQRGWEYVRSGAAYDRGTYAALLGHGAYHLLGQNRVDEAHEAIQLACQHENFAAAHWRTRTRLLAKQAEVLRRLGDVERAADCLDQAERIAREHASTADVPELVWTRRAKLLAARDPAAARALLRRTRRAQAANRQWQGVARTLLLEARLAPHTSAARRLCTCEAIRRRVERLRDQRPALAHCQLLKKILDNWSSWTEDGMVAGESDRYWRL